MRIATFLTVGAALAMLVASDAGGAPRPDERGKTYVFPAGRYILAGGAEAALGDDVKELLDDFIMKPGQYILSGGPNPTDEIIVDDDLEIRQDGKALFIDDDHVATTNKRGKSAASFQGHPIIFVADPKLKLKLTATDHNPVDAILGPLWLHRHDGAKRQLTPGLTQQSADQLPHVFFDQEFDLTKDFEMPATIREAKGSVIDLPERPATLLPKNQPKK
jgi:hypothetical protein